MKNYYHCGCGGRLVSDLYIDPKSFRYVVESNELFMCVYGLYKFSRVSSVADKSAFPKAADDDDLGNEPEFSYFTIIMF